MDCAHQHVHTYFLNEVEKLEEREISRGRLMVQDSD